MKRILIFLLALLLLTGCGTKAPAAEAPTAEKPAEEIPVEEAPVEEVPVEETPAEEPAEEPREYFGDFSGKTITGEALDQTFFANADLTIINMWATFCEPCKMEMPFLGAIDKEMENVQVLGVVTDVVNQNGELEESQVELALELLDAYGCGYPNLVYDQSLTHIPRFAYLSGVPTTYFVDKEGNVVGLGFLGALDEDSWQQIIAERLEMAQS